MDAVVAHRRRNATEVDFGGTERTVSRILQTTSIYMMGLRSTVEEGNCVGLAHVIKVCLHTGGEHHETESY